MIPHLIPLVSAFLTRDVYTTLLYPLFCVYFIAAAPSLIRSFTRWR